MGLERKRWPSRWRLGCRHSALFGPAVVATVAPVPDGSRPVSERHDQSWLSLGTQSRFSGEAEKIKAFKTADRMTFDLERGS